MRSTFQHLSASLLILLFVSGTTWATISPIDSVTVNTIATNGGGTAYIIESITADGVAFTVDGLVFGVSDGEVTDVTPQLNEIVAADNYDLNATFGRDGVAEPEWRVRSFGGQPAFSSINGSDPDFFLFEVGGDDLIEARAVPSTGNVGNWVTLSAASGGAGYNWGGTGLIKTDSYNTLNNGEEIYGLAFDITDLGVAADATLQGIDFRGATIDGAAVLAAIPEPAAGTLILMGLGALLWRQRRR